MSTGIIAWIRTIVPIGVASALSWLLVTFGLQLDKASEDGLVVGITGLLIAVYYTLARLLEKKFPWLGVLLGVAQTADSYSKGETGVVFTEVQLDPLNNSSEVFVAQHEARKEQFLAYSQEPLPIPVDPDTPLYYATLNDQRA